MRIWIAFFVSLIFMMSCSHVDTPRSPSSEKVDGKIFNPNIVYSIKNRSKILPFSTEHNNYILEETAYSHYTPIYKLYQSSSVFKVYNDVCADLENDFRQNNILPKYIGEEYGGNYTYKDIRGWEKSEHRDRDKAGFATLNSGSISNILDSELEIKRKILNSKVPLERDLFSTHFNKKETLSDDRQGEKKNRIWFA